MGKPYMIHIGRNVPKELAQRGWCEVPGLSIHLGRGIWMLRLELSPNVPGVPGRELARVGTAWLSAWKQIRDVLASCTDEGP
jgi:hypothetical protein